MSVALPLVFFQGPYRLDEVDLQCGKSKLTLHRSKLCMYMAALLSLGAILFVNKIVLHKCLTAVSYVFC